MVLGGIASAVGGVIAGGLDALQADQQLAKLTITPLPKNSKLEPIELPFNPNSYTIEKQVTWNTGDGYVEGEQNKTRRYLNAPESVFGGGSRRTLRFSELFFDVTEYAPPIDVRTLTDQLVALTRIDRTLGRPPVCEINWGSGDFLDFPFKGVATNLSQSFTLFSGDGTPLRAKLSITFKEYLVAEEDLKKTDPELTTYIVKRGDTLSSIAAQMYGDAKLWRMIAEANALDNPRQLNLIIGQSLTIPSLG